MMIWVLTIRRTSIFNEYLVRNQNALKITSPCCVQLDRTLETHAPNTLKLGSKRALENMYALNTENENELSMPICSSVHQIYRKLYYFHLRGLFIWDFRTAHIGLCNKVEFYDAVVRICSNSLNGTCILSQSTVVIWSPSNWYPIIS